MWVIPTWRVTAELPEKTNLARPHNVVLSVLDGDLEAVLRAVKASGYETVTFEREHPFTPQDAEWKDAPDA